MRQLEEARPLCQSMPGNRPSSSFQVCNWMAITFASHFDGSAVK
jgi:hypothetical protein